MTREPLAVLFEYWGHASFRPLQAEIIRSVLDGHDTLALLPTGGGKSVCFQVPTLCREGMCLVVSPLIALMKDQVEHLRRRNIVAEAIYSGMAYRDIDRILDNCVYGGVRFLYLSPERLLTDLLKERLRRMPIRLIAVDEAHCISQWGYDFRPPYLEIAAIREHFPDVAVLALTASATPEVVTDIQEKLAFRRGHQLFQAGFERPNLAYVVRQGEGKEAQLRDMLRKVKGSALVYVRNRRKTQEIAANLERAGIRAGYYHAGLDLEERTQRQEAWQRGDLRVMAATNAFGMGIDKPDVRLVVHLDLPDSLEAYYQEAGRAGRDGKKSYVVLLYNELDRKRLERQFELSFPDMDELRRTYRALGSYFQLAVGGGRGESLDFDLTEFAKTYQLDPLVAYHALHVLEQAGWIAVTEAVYVPATLLIKVDKDHLYDYQLRHPKLDQILKVILRTYQGAFSQAVIVKERQLAKFLKMPAAALRQGLLTLHQDGIVDYQPARDQPQLIFLRERVDADNLTIDLALYRFRKERHEQRMRAAIAYAETPVCRSQQLQRYFGQTDAPRCGQCDVCLAERRGDLSTTEFDRYREKIKELLGAEGLAPEAVLQAFTPQQEAKVRRALKWLLDEGWVRLEGKMLRWKR